MGKEGGRWSSTSSPATSGNTAQPYGRVPTGLAAPPAVGHSGSSGGGRSPG